MKTFEKIEEEHSISNSDKFQESASESSTGEVSGSDFIKTEDKLEDIRMSSTLFNQVRVADYVSLYFSLTAVGLFLIAYEKDYHNLMENLDYGHPDVIRVDIIMWIAFIFNMLLLVSIVIRHYIYFKWLHAKKLIT